MRAGQYRMSSRRLCTCGHEERDHFVSDERGCHWSTGTGANYCDCPCDGFEPVAGSEPEPEFEVVNLFDDERIDGDRTAALGEAAADSMTRQLLTPLPSISRISGLIEKLSPLFCESPANSQLKLF